MLGAVEGPGEVQELRVGRSCPGRRSYFWLVPARLPSRHFLREFTFSLLNVPWLRLLDMSREPAPYRFWAFRA